MAKRYKSSAKQLKNLAKGAKGGRRGNKNGEKTWFKKGVSPNPGGRPKSAEAAQAAREILASPLGSHSVEPTGADALMERIYARAISGDMQAAQMFLDRAEGKPRQQMEHSGPNGGSIPVEIKAKSLAELAAEILKERSQDANAS